MKLKISEIVIGERRREDMGDIQGLAESIKQYGLLHPIVVSEDKKLVAGGRRLEACKLLGWEEIPATFLGELSDKQLREIELEENLRRKDLTEIEKSRNMVELANIKAGQIKPSMAQRAIDKPGPNRQPNSKRTIATELGIPRKTLTEAYQHVDAVDKYPELETYPKKRAIEISRQLDTLSEPEQKEVLKQIQEVNEFGRQRMERADEVHRIKKTFANAIYGAALLPIDEHHLEMWLSDLSPTDLQKQADLVEDGLRRLATLKTHLKALFGGPRLIYSGGTK
ncbi:MAG: ParB/RepB/Spo0J family partition protein [Bacillota bacterium]